MKKRNIIRTVGLDLVYIFFFIDLQGICLMDTLLEKLILIKITEATGKVGRIINVSSVIHSWMKKEIF